MKAAGSVRFHKAELDDVIALAKAAHDRYAAEVLRSDQLSVGLYILAAGATDDQVPHSEEEVYYTVRGRATFRIGAEDHPVRPGDAAVRARDGRPLLSRDLGGAHPGGVLGAARGVGAV